MNKTQFIDEVLLEHHLPLGLWGKNALEKIDRLYSGYDAGLFSVIRLDDGRIAIRHQLTHIRIIRGMQMLIETLRQYRNGHITLRSSGWTISERLPHGKTAKDFIKQRLHSILRDRLANYEGKDDLGDVKMYFSNKKPVSHPVYPGLWLADQEYRGEWTLPRELYCKAGYEERCATYEAAFEWVDLIILPDLVRKSA